MAGEEEINNCMASLGIEEEENEGFILERDIDEEVNKYELCLVGRLLTEKSINVRAMKSKIADVWRPAMALTIKEIDQGLFLFQFYRKEDKQWVQNGGPWSFDNAMLALEEVRTGQNPVDVKPCFLSIWVQFHNLPVGYMLETVGKQLGNFFGEFLEYDAKNSASIWRDCMRVRIRIDVRKPLKRKKKIIKKDGQEFIVMFCRNTVGNDEAEGGKEWGSWLRAPPRRAAGQVQSKWLRVENDDTWESRIGGENFAGEKFSKKGKEIRVVRNYRQEGETESINKDKSLAKMKEASFKGFSTTSNLLYGLNEEENDAIQLEDRKRRRGLNNGLGIMEIDMGQNQQVVQTSQRN